MSQTQETQCGLVLHLDNSPESQAVAKALTDAKVAFRSVFGSTAVDCLPAIETPSGILCGYGDIRRYLLPDADIEY